MTGLGLVTKGKICPIVESIQGGYVSGGIVYRDKPYKKPTKQECEAIYLPKIRVELIRILRDKTFFVKVRLINN